MRLLRMREQELKERIAIVQNDTERLQKKLDQTREKTEQKKLDLRKCVHTEAKRIQRSAINESERRILLQALPGDSSFDVKYLQKKLAVLKKEMAELQEAAHQTMMPKERGKPLEEEIKRLELEERLPLSDEESRRRREEKLLNVALVAAQEYEHNLKYVRPQCSITQHIINKLNEVSRSDYQTSDHGSAFEDNEEMRGHQKALFSMDTFTRLMEEKNYHDAAVLATVHCPEVLRNHSTLNQFQKAEASKTVPEPFLCYCEAMVTLPGIAMDESETMECAFFMMRKGMLREVEKWMTMRKLTPSAGLGDLLLKYAKHSNSTDEKRRAVHLAEAVYLRCGGYVQALSCMVMQGQLQRMLSIARRMPSMGRANFVEVLQRHPSADVGFALMSESRSPCQPALTAAEVLTGLADGGSASATMTVALKLFGQSLDGLEAYMIEDNRTTKSEWARVADLCGKLPGLDELVDKIGTCLSQKFPEQQLATE
ncbi:uncharacterized protein LOC135817855 isoform X2 [Sycon ciliatum]